MQYFLLFFLSNLFEYNFVVNKPNLDSPVIVDRTNVKHLYVSKTI